MRNACGAKVASNCQENFLSTIRSAPVRKILAMLRAIPREVKSMSSTSSSLAKQLHRNVHNREEIMWLLLH
eukprot:6436451-Amphidinium_carterae.1